MTFTSGSRGSSVVKFFARDFVGTTKAAVYKGKTRLVVLRVTRVVSAR